MDDPLPWMVLIRACINSPVQQLTLLDIFKCPQHIVAVDESRLRALGLNNNIVASIKHPDTKQLDADMAWLDQAGHYLVTWNDKKYPSCLREIPDPPAALFVAGDPDTLNMLQLGIVGSRNPSASGRRVAYSFANQLSEHGFAITSGLASGIDYCAHQGAIDRNGYTIAVLGCGADRIYPSRHSYLAEKITRHGALVSEFPPGTAPLARNFPRRNRVISGLSTGILVVEADRRSGSLITAHFAADQGRDVFAVPGSIYNPLTKGCHYLIKQGAKLVESLEDILEEIQASPRSVHTGIGKQDNAGDSVTDFDIKYRQLLDNLSFDPVSVDTLVDITGLTSETVSSMLLILEIRGIVSSSHGMYMRIS